LGFLILVLSLSHSRHARTGAAVEDALALASLTAMEVSDLRVAVWRFYGDPK